MKYKNNLYLDPPLKVPYTQTLETLSLFTRNENGRLVHAVRQDQPHPEVAERRGRRRHEWRQNAFCRTWQSGEALSDWFTVWCCEVSRGGFSMLTEELLSAGMFIDLCQPGVAEIGELPLAEVLQCIPKGRVWLVRCQWLLELHKPGVRLLIGKPSKQPDEAADEPDSPRGGWVLRLWSLFHNSRKAA
ncbi:MAG: hypothetical protein JNM56_33530 [Planctomycetia bacterium]|nr:hypothetical protein [Planctomycetia bacterium]